MAKTDTEIHHIELLLTLDYLLNHTDEDHPASQQDICRHATKYGLQYKGGVAGDDVKRQRIAKCLEFLEEITNDFTDDVPFVLETTESGKYYVEQKNGLDSSQVAKIIAAIKNDKYTRNDDVEFLVDRILSTFGTSEQNKEDIKRESNRLLRGVKKLDKESLRKIRLVDKAYKENRLIKIHHKILRPETQKWDEFDMWYKVYLIKEFRDKLYAFLLPVSMGNIRMRFIFDPIELITIADGPDKFVLNYDDDENKDFGDCEELFRRNQPRLAEKYGSLDNYVERTIIPIGGKASIITFRFNLNLKDIIKKSFENYFNEDFRYQEIAIYKNVEQEIKKLANELGSFEIIYTDEPDGKKPPTHGLVNFSVSEKSFKAWLLTDPYGEGHVCMADFVTILKPSTMYEELADYHYRKLGRLAKYLPRKMKDSMFNALINMYGAD